MKDENVLMMHQDGKNYVRYEDYASEIKKRDEGIREAIKERDNEFDRAEKWRSKSWDLEHELSALKERVSGWVDITKERDLEERVSALKKRVEAAEKLATENGKEICRFRNKLEVAEKEVERLTHLHNLDHSLADQWEKKNEELTALLEASREREGVMRKALQDIKFDIRHDGECVHLHDPKKKCSCIANYLYQTAKNAIAVVEGKGEV